MGAAALGLALLGLEHQIGWTSSLALPVLLAAAVLTALFLVMRHNAQKLDWRALASAIEARHPELQGRLLTAVQQGASNTAELNYLQERVLREALLHDHRTDWSGSIPLSRLVIAQTAHWLALLVFAITLFGLRATSGTALLARRFSSGLTVTPGDANLERGSSLVVLARFSGRLPAAVHLVVGEGSTTRIPLVKSLGDPMFGGSLADVSSNLVYHVEYAGERTRDFKVTVYEHPRLERADVALTFPEYTSLPAKHIPETRRVSAVEGSQLDLELTLNKPVTSAALVAKDKEPHPIQLSVQADQPKASLKQFALNASHTYELQLVDADGRTNKVPAQFVFEALKNRSPEIRLTSPRGDLRPSPLEEISFQGTVWDDFGIPAYGLGYMAAGREPQFIELGQGVPAQEKKTFSHLLRLEDLGVLPDQVISWFVWADDIGPDGKTRRTSGDLFFGEVRPFEEVFREGQGMDGQSPGMEGDRQSQTAKLAELQKQIISATWKLQHAPKSAPVPRSSATRGQESRALQPGASHLAKGTGESLPNGPNPNRAAVSSFSDFGFRPSFGLRISSLGLGPWPLNLQIMGQVAQESNEDSPANAPPPKRETTKPRPASSNPPTLEEDVGVVHDSQAQALSQARTALERQRDPRAAALWQAAIKDMQEAITRLRIAKDSPGLLKDALAAEQAAYQALLRLQEHEYQVSRSRNRSQSGAGRDQQLQRQLEQLDLTQSEDRYETQREAQRPQTPRREQLQIMNRLQELAKRQQDLNERLKELQTALQEARTPEEKAEIQRRLKRLQEEEQQMLADVDEVRQRMDRPENQSQMAEQRRQLDQTREEVQRAAQAAGQGATAQALASGTRAQRQFQEMRDQMRKENSSQFAQDMREMRAQARDLAQRQEDILKNLQKENSSERKALSDSGERQQMLEQMIRQSEVTTNLLDRANQVSQQAEASEPLLSSQLYDSMRKFSQQSSKELKETTDQLLNRGLMTRNLFDRLKESTGPDATKMQDITSEMLKLGFLPQASEAGERARAGIEELKNGIEHAAESVLGDDTESLRFVQQELDQLAEQLRNEISQVKAEGSQTNGGTLAAAQPGAETETNRLSSGSGRNQRQQLAQNANQDRQPARASANANETESSERSGQPNREAQGSQSGRGAQPGSRQRSNEANRSSSEQAASDAQQDSDAAGQAQQPGGGSGPARSGSRPRATQRGVRLDNADGGEGGGSANLNFDRLLNEDAWRQSGPLTGDDFVNWSDRLREVEEVLDQPELRNEIAMARDRAGAMRRDFKRDRKKPDWAVVQLQVMQPLTEVRDRLAEELIRRQSREALVPIDRDPVPNRYSDLVRRYYEQLGKDK
jgi:hypothetical protein